MHGVAASSRRWRSGTAACAGRRWLSVMRRSALYLSSDEDKGWRRARVSADVRQGEGLFTAIMESSP